MARILIADDHPLFRRGLRDTIMELFKGMEIDEAENGQEVLKMVLEADYDVVILDISMPGRNGLEILEELKQLKPATRVLMMSFHPESQYALQAMKLGAHGYLTKDGAPRELQLVLKKVLSGHKHFNTVVMEQLVSELQRDQSKKPHELLTVRELEVLKMIAAGKKLTCIAEELSLSVSSVSTYRIRILKKMGLRSNAELIRYSIEENILD